MKNRQLLFLTQSTLWNLICFVKVFSTDRQHVYSTQSYLKKDDGGKYFGIVIPDLKKAFDTVNYDILLAKHKALVFNEYSTWWVGNKW